MEPIERFLSVHEFDSKKVVSTQTVFMKIFSMLIYAIMNYFLGAVFYKFKKVRFYRQMISKKEGRSA